MRARLLIPAAAAASLLSLAAPVSAQSPAPTASQTPTGLWQAVDDDTKQPTGWFLIANHDGVYSGIIAKMFLKPGEDPNAVCSQCKDDRLNHPWLGLEIIRGMKQDSRQAGKIRRRHHPRSARRQGLQGQYDGDARRPDLGGARLYRHFAVGQESILDAPAGLGHDHARPVGEPESGGRSTRSRQQAGAGAQTATCCARCGARGGSKIARRSVRACIHPDTRPVQLREGRQFLAGARGDTVGTAGFVTVWRTVHCPVCAIA